MHSFIRDLRIGIRVLIKEKSFCALAVSVIALGICGVTTMFSVVNGVMLRGFSFPNGDRLVSVRFIDPTTRSLTLWISTLAMALAIPLGMLLALARKYGGALTSRVAHVYVEIYRGTPVLLQLYLIYFGLAPVLRLVPAG